MIRKSPWVIFTLVLVWKVALYLFTAQPVPANDSYFYDGAVIHHLLHGGYFNPTVRFGFPISGGEIFSAYPPGYQLPLLVWMSVFGVSALSAMGFHLVLFCSFAFVLWAILRRLQIPPLAQNITALFLFGFTFHDRPDSFAHLLGVLAVYACVRSRKTLGRDPTDSQTKWVWLMVMFIVLAFCTSLQIGGIYFLVVSLATLASCYMDDEKIPFGAMSLMMIVPAILVALAHLFLPRAWAGFMENVRQTPFITGFRLAHWQEAAKIIRTVPGVLLVTFLLPISWFKQRADFSSRSGRRNEIILLAALLPALGILAASLTIIAPNTVAISNYLQPLIVAAYLALAGNLGLSKRWLQLHAVFFVPMILLILVRPIGMTTWGVACARDFSYRQSVQCTNEELKNRPAGSTAILSSAFLYATSTQNDPGLIHSDWMMPARGDSRISDTQGIKNLKPTLMIFTQYDYYRRFQTVLDGMRGSAELKEIEVTNMAHMRAPDSYKSMQQVVQHVSWAPVVVHLKWANN